MLSRRAIVTTLAAVCALVPCLGACAAGEGDDAGVGGPFDSGAPDESPATQDGSPTSHDAAPDASHPDAGAGSDTGADAGSGADSGTDSDADSDSASDSGSDAASDSGNGDATLDGASDGGLSDAGPPDAPDGGILGTPCKWAQGGTAWRFHYDPNNGTNAILDVYGLPDNSNWEAVPAFSTQIDDVNNGGGLDLGSGNWILIRYSVAGLTQINSATLTVFGRSFDVSASGSFDGWTPLYGDNAAPTDSLSNVWPYTSDSIDFTGSVHVGDDPNLTGIRLYSGPSSNTLIVNTVELCIDGF